MPVYPIGKVKRKGTLGSYYAISDYTAVNPEFGSFTEFKAMVEEIHRLEMYVLLDWVANHTAWDHPLVQSHPDWYVQDGHGNILPPFDWEDVADLDYSNPAVWDYMSDCMLFWVREANVDGFRCDVADLVPDSFWERARVKLNAEKEVFMLAEAEHPPHHKLAFDMCYASRFHRAMYAIASGSKKPRELQTLFQTMKSDFPMDTWFMQFITNHDENTWNGSEFERYGEAVTLFITLYFLIPDMPLIYSGQETGLKKRISFFEKDEITWENSPYFEMYQSLIALKKRHPALWNGRYGGTVKWLETNKVDSVLSFTREKADDRIFALFNFTNQVQNVIVKGEVHKGRFVNHYTGNSRAFKGYDCIVLEPYEASVFASG